MLFMGSVVAPWRMARPRRVESYRWIARPVTDGCILERVWIPACAGMTKAVEASSEHNAGTVGLDTISTDGGCSPPHSAGLRRDDGRCSAPLSGFMRSRRTVSAARSGSKRKRSAGLCGSCIRPKRGQSAIAQTNGACTGRSHTGANSEVQVRVRSLLAYCFRIYCFFA